MRTKSKYTTPIHKECVTKFLNPPSKHGAAPNYIIRELIIEWARDGKNLSPAALQREYSKRTGQEIGRTRIVYYIDKLGAETIKKLRNGLLVFGIISATVLGQLTVKAIFPTVRDMVFPKVYATDQIIESLDGAVSHTSEANAGQTVIAEAAPSSSLSERQQILMYIVEKFGDRSHEAIAMLAKCENSKLDPKATNHNRNGTVDRGIFQINSIHGGEEMFDWRTNIDKAYEIYTAHDNTFYAWTCGYVTGDRTYVDAMRGK